jgi:hypothetical protein
MNRTSNLYVASLSLLVAFLCSGNVASYAQPAGQTRYCLSRVQFDPLLSKRWAILATLGRADRPLISVPMEDLKVDSWPECSRQPSEPTASPVLVHSGDPIRIWKHESLLNIDLAGVAEESGGLGQRIRIRIEPTPIGSDTLLSHLSGTVRGPANVEIRP